ncbi:phage tail tape measure protein [Mitsuaria sp. GD03876]|uniref:phage tail tape measure protein n=1 Tax=Mitsuaria sp. GD03876 TaxID=2975399 RepID=UPI00244CA55E|nr:phage tail tape measure protein [Mitsuaria sp. GD03876]MDH0866464.1 phage tail tape measure protein [Mitsuaria sp. GD03876]
MSDLRLQVILQAIDRATAPLQRINTGSTATAKALRETRERLKELGTQQKAIGEFREMRTGLGATSAKLENAREKATRLARELSQAGPPTKAMTAQLATARQFARDLADQHQRQSVQLQAVRDRLSAVGISTRDLATHERDLRSSIASTTESIGRQTAALRELAERQRRSVAAGAALSKAQALQGKLTGTGVAMGATGAAIGAPIAIAVRDFASFEDHMLGIARQVQGARDDAGRLTPVYAAVRQQIRELGREIPLATNEIADMVTAGARMEVATDQLKDFTRTAAMMATAFDAVPGEIAEQMGKVAKNFKIPIMQIEGLADSINYLDDNAISKGDEIINVLNRISGVVSTVKMSAQDAAALSSTLLTLGERPETAATAINAITQKLAAATKGTKKFQAAVDEIGLKSKDIQQGMATDASATFDKVIAGIRRLPESQRVGVMVELVGLEHSDTLAKLVDKPEELARQRELANGTAAKGSMRREADARSQTTSAQWIMAKNRAFELTTTLGEALKPALVDIMTTLGSMASKLAAFAAAHPGLVSFILKAAAALSVLLVVGGTVTVALASLIGPFALLRYGMAMLSINGVGVASVIGRIGSALRIAGQAVLWLGRALLMTPIGLAITAIAVAAFLLIRYWEPIKAFFGGVWSSVREAFSGGIGGVSALLVNWSPLGLLYHAFAGVLRWFGFDLPQKFSEFGANILQGLAGGITSRLALVRDAISGAADGAIGWFKEKLGIRSPSRVFIDAGEEISNGAAAGVANRQASVRRAVMAMAVGATVAMPAAAMNVSPDGDFSTRPSTVHMDRRAPLSAPAAAAPVSAGDKYEIHIHAAPGMDERTLARVVCAELDRRERTKLAARRSSLSDIS